jgi:hypothetical protein
MAKAIINKARRALASIGDALSDEDREEMHDLLDEAEEASDDGQDVTKSIERLTSRINRAKEKATEDKKSGKGGQPKPPASKKDDGGSGDSDGKPERTHSASKSWFGA